MDDLVQAICTEIKLRKNYLNTSQLTSIYFGGGTPSLLSENALMRIFDEISQHFSWGNDIEITLEANPDDISQQYIRWLKKTPVNRFSLGIQSFFEEDLQYMHRAHDAKQALQCLPMLQDAGFEKLSADLIYGTPTLSTIHLKKNLDVLLRHQVAHISAYALTVEPRTPLQKQIDRKEKVAPSDQLVEEQFKFLMDFLSGQNYIHYEISNFATEGNMAVHNSNYWKNVPYLGVGPAAHSFDVQTRSWNVANNLQYIQSMEQGVLANEIEQIDMKTAYNEYVMTGLRTMWGVEEGDILARFGETFLSFFIGQISQMDQQFFKKERGHWKLSQEGKLFCDAISADLFWTE